MKVSTGSSRIVFLIGKWAIKIPRINAGYRMFLRGIVGNYDEERLYKENIRYHRHLQFAPVIFGFFGLITIMRRAKPFNGSIPDNWHTVQYKNSYWQVECKKDSFGLIDGHIVAVDYGIVI